MTSDDLEKMRQGVTPERFQAGWEAALDRYGNVYHALIARGVDRGVASQVASLRADATFLCVAYDLGEFE